MAGNTNGRSKVDKRFMHQTKYTFSVHRIIFKRYTFCFTTPGHIDKTAISQPSLYLKGVLWSCLSEMKHDLFVNQGMLWKRNFTLLLFLL